MTSDLEDLRSKIAKAHGADVLVRLSGRKAEAIPVVSSGSLSLDVALGVGGYPRGRIVEIYGPESSGKTTLALHAIAETQRDGGVAAFIDAEHAFDLKYAQALGIKVDSLLFSQPDFGEQALNVTQDLVESGSVDLVVVDSVAALTPKVEIDGEVGDPHMGVHARMMSQAMRKLASAVSKAEAIVIFINQIRMKIGVLYGSPEVTTGGNALKFYASIRLDVRRREQVKEQGGEQDAIGNHTLVKVVKNKVAPPFREANVDIIWGSGIDHIGDLLSCAVEAGVVEKSGAWFSYGGERIGQGFNNSVARLKATPQWLQEINTKTRAKVLP